MVKEYPILEEIVIDSDSITPKYLQLAKAIRRAIGEERIKMNEVLPSINELSFSLDISRDTVEKSYRHLKEVGVLASVPGKGYYVKQPVDESYPRVLLLFNKISDNKRIIYDAFVETLGDKAWVDFYVYNNDFSAFRKLLTNRSEDYTHFVIIAMFSEDVLNAHEIINTIPKEKLILFDKMVPGINGNYGAVYENFEKDIYLALEGLLDRITKYTRIKLIFPNDTYYPGEIIEGVKRFCLHYSFPFEVVQGIRKAPVNAGDLFITISEEDLITLSERLLSKNYKAGKDVGMISYNDAPYKRLLLDGITTVSTDFHSMGKQAATMILENNPEHIEIPFLVTVRNSV